MTDDQHADPFTVLANHLGVPREQVMNMGRGQLTEARDDAETELTALARRGQLHTVPGHRPRRSPADGAPKITESDRPPDAEVEAARESTRRRWEPRRVR